MENEPDPQWSNQEQAETIYDGCTFTLCERTGGAYIKVDPHSNKLPALQNSFFAFELRGNLTPEEQFAKADEVAAYLNENIGKISQTVFYPGLPFGLADDADTR